MRFEQLEYLNKFEDFLMFQSLIEDKEMDPDEREYKNCIEIIKNLYKEIVPEYLIEDHPAGVPEIVVPLIKSQVKFRSNGKDAQQMEDEFALIFRENELGSKGLQEASGTKKTSEKYKTLYQLNDPFMLKV